jgi:hypothetical protein
LFREVNERVSEINQANEMWLTPTQWVCECADQSCTGRVELSPEEYEKIRESPTRFFVLPDDDHVVPEVELVVERHPRYWVVEKVGPAAAVTEHLDPRSRD